DGESDAIVAFLGTLTDAGQRVAEEAPPPIANAPIASAPIATAPTPPRARPPHHDKRTLANQPQPDPEP
ncbi:MAG TPA: hypothetical protein VGL86_30790, partial [Polyangia bacterium]